MVLQQNALVGCIRKLCGPLEPIPTGARPYLPLLSGIRAVAFDVYGTLLISGSGDIGVNAATDRVEALTEALNALSLRYESGAPARGVELLKHHVLQAHEQRRKLGARYPEVDIRAVWSDVLASLRAERLIGSTPPISGIERLAVEYECRVNPVAAMPGLEELLDGLRRQGLVTGIVSNAQFFTPLLFPAIVDKSVEDLGFRSRMCVWSYHILEAKPSVVLYASMASRLRSDFGIEPKNTLYIGNDMLNDVAGARGLGMRTALFAGDKRSLRLRRGHPVCKGVRPDAVVTQLPQILTMLPPT